MNNLHKTTICLAHQHVEDQATPFGMVCPQCKRRLYTNPPQGNLMSYWESQPVAYTLKGEPCFAYTLNWGSYLIRSLHLPEDELVVQESPEIESHF